MEEMAGEWEVEGEALQLEVKAGGGEGTGKGEETKGICKKGGRERRLRTAEWKVR